MKKRSFTVLAFLMVFALLVTACAGAQEEPVDAEEPADVEEPVEVEEAPKVALLLSGTISDQGWNAMGYAGLRAIEEQYGAEVSYTESVSQSDMEGVFVNYAELGYDLIFGHGSQFSDAALVAAERYPDTHYVLINGIVSADNVASIQTSGHQAGFLTGAFAALMSESGTVGFIGGLEIPPITNAADGFEAGAKYVNPDIEVLSAITGSFDDAAAAKETALAFIDRGADVIAPLANVAGLGAFEACEDRGVYGIGGNSDQYEIAPGNILVSVIKELSISFTFAYEQVLEGSLSGQIYKLGVKENAVYYSSYHDHADKISKEVQDKLDAIVAGIMEGNIEI